MTNTPIENSGNDINEDFKNLVGFFDVLIQMDLAQTESIHQKLHKQEGVFDDSN